MSDFIKELAETVETLFDLDQRSNTVIAADKISFTWTEMYPFEIILNVNPDNSFNETVDGDVTGEFNTIDQYIKYVNGLFE